MERLYAKVLVAAVALAMTVSVVTAGGALSSHTQESPEQDTSYLRVAHTAPDAPAVNVTVGNETVASNVAFGNVSDYMSFTEGTHNVSVTTARGFELTLFEGNVSLESGTATTLYATGEVSTGADTSFEPVTLQDDAFTPDDNESALSVAHMSPDAGPVDVVIVGGPDDDTDGATPTETMTLTETETPGENGTETPDGNETETLTPTETETPTPTETMTPAEGGTEEMVVAEDLTFRNASAYVNVPEGNYTVEIRAADTDEVVATVDLSVEGGQAYTAIAAGYANPEDSPAGDSFTVETVQDATMSITLPETADSIDETATPTTNGTDVPAVNATDTPMNGTETPTMNETETPEGTDTPEGTETPEGTDTPEGTETPTETEAP